MRHRSVARVGGRKPERFSVLVEVELATLPRDGAEDGFACGGHPWVVFADDEGAVAVAEQAFIPDPFRADVEDEVAALATSTS